MADFSKPCDLFKDLFGGNIALICCLVLSFIFDAAAVWNLAITIKNHTKVLTSVYSGLAAFFSFAGIFTWFIFAWSNIGFVYTMTFGVWFLLSTAAIQFICYLINRYYVNVFNKSAFFRQILETEELEKGPLQESTEIFAP